MFRHRVYLCVKFPLDFDHVFLISLGNQIYSKAYLPEPTTSSDSMQVGAALSWEIEIDDDVNCWNIDSSGDKIGTDQCFELSLSKSLEDIDPLFSRDL